jgi:integrase
MFIKSNRGWLALSFTFNGERCTEYLHLHDNRDNRREAEKLARDIEAEMRAGSFDYAHRFSNSTKLDRLGLKPSADPMLGEFALRWLDEQVHLSAASANHYRLLLKKHLLPFPIASKRLSQIADGDVNRLIGALREGFEGSRWSGLRTINMVIARLRTIFATAKRRKLIADDPMAYVRNLRQPRPDAEPFDLNEAQRLVAAARGWERAFIAILLFTGLRPNEALALRWSQIDWPHKLIRVRQNVGRDGRLGLPKTAASQREVEMIGSLRKLLTEQQARSRLKGELVFPSASATPIDLDNFRSRNWPRIQLRAGVRPRNIYQCRHTFARLAIEHGDTPQHVAAQLGHTSVKMVFDVYSRWIERPTSAAMDALDRAISITHPSPIFGGESAGTAGKRR